MDTNFRRYLGRKILGGLLIATVLAGGASRGAESPFNLEEYRGRVVVLDFWASWCVPCRRSFPWMNRMQEKYADQGLVVIGVNMDSNSEEAQAFLSEFPPAFKIVADADGVLAQQFEVEAMPSSYIIDRRGNVAATHLGFRVKKVDEYEAKIREILFSGED